VGAAAVIPNVSWYDDPRAVAAVVDP
jgi:hypothetical protein